MQDKLDDKKYSLGDIVKYICIFGIVTLACSTVDAYLKYDARKAEMVRYDLMLAKQNLIMSETSEILERLEKLEKAQENANIFINPEIDV